MTITEMLDQLADFYAQIDYLNMQKQELIDAVKVPAEVQAIHEEGLRRKAALTTEYENQLLILEAKKTEQLEAVVVPPEVRAIYEAIQAKRREIEAENEAKKREAWFQTVKKQGEVDDEFSSRVRGVYEELEARKAEINAEFDGKAESANENIASLTARIKAETIKEGHTVRGAHWQAVYVKGRVTWNTDMLDGMIVAFPALVKARKEGQPSITLRRN